MGRDSILKIAEVKYRVTSLGVFLCCARYVLTELLACLRMVSGSGGGGAHLYVPLSPYRLLYTLGICRLLQNTAVDPVPALVAVGRLTKIDEKALEDRE